MSIIKHFGRIILLITGILVSQADGQPANLVLQDTTIATVAIFAAGNSITAGPNFTIAGTGDATFVTGGFIYLRPGIVIIQGGKLRTIIGRTVTSVGDADGDGTVSAFDASLVLQHVVGLITLGPDERIAADVDGDGSISAFDASLVLQFVVGLRTCFPVEPGCTSVSKLAPSSRRNMK